ncbi:MAG: ABC transporter permease [Candidatus Geothermincolia bacterium]
MGEIWNGIKQAVDLIIHFDPYVMRVTLFTLYICALATLAGALVGIPLGTWLGLYRFRGRRAFVVLINAGMGLPPVVVGLFVFLFLKRQGPLGFLGWLYSPTAIFIAEVVLAMPLIAGITMAALQGQDPNLRLQSLSLGASPFRSVLTLLRESRLSLMAALMAGFGAIISEVGAAMMVGGNLMLGQTPYTRTLTTSTVLAVNAGDSVLAIALGMILLSLTVLIIIPMTLIQQRTKQATWLRSLKASFWFRRFEQRQG